MSCGEQEAARESRIKNLEGLGGPCLLIGCFKLGSVGLRICI